MIKLAFYKARRTLFDKAVTVVTYGPYSHVEMVDPYDASGWASIWHEGGVRNRKGMDWDDSKWDMLSVPGDARLARERMRKMLGWGYNVVGLLSFIVPLLHARRKRRVMCAEAVAIAMGMDQPWGLSPNGLFRRLTGAPGASPD